MEFEVYNICEDHQYSQTCFCRSREALAGQAACHPVIRYYS